MATEPPKSARLQETEDAPNSSRAGRTSDWDFHLDEELEADAKAAAEAKKEAAKASATTPVAAASGEMCMTVPPPVPPDEYVERAMHAATPRATHPAPAAPREPLETLREDEPLRFDVVPDRRVNEQTPTLVPPPEVLQGGARQNEPALEMDTLVDGLEAALQTPTVPAPSGDDAGMDVEVDVDVEIEFNESLISDPDLDRPPLPRADDEPARPIDEMREAFENGEYPRAFRLATERLAQSPGDEAATRYADSSREMLRQLFLNHLGGRAQVFRVVLAPHEIRWLSLDHRAGFLLSCIDGEASVEELLDVCGMPEFDALHILDELLQVGAIEKVVRIAQRT